MTTRHIAFGWLSSFDGQGAGTANVLPLRCRLRSGKAARVITLVNGVAVNIDGTSGSQVRYPVEQQLEVLIRGSSVASGSAVDDYLGNFATRIGKQATLQVHVPGARRYTAPAILDDIEIVDEGQMADDKKINWCIARLTFQQMEAWQ